MKNWEEILRSRLSSFQEKGALGQEDAIWKSIEAKIAPASGSSAALSSYSWAGWFGLVASAIGLGLGVDYFFHEEPIVGKERAHLEERMDTDEVNKKVQSFQTNVFDGDEEKQSGPLVSSVEKGRVAQEVRIKNEIETKSVEVLIDAKVEDESFKGTNTAQDEQKVVMPINEGANVYVGADLPVFQQKQNGTVKADSPAPNASADGTYTGSVVKNRSILFLSPRLLQTAAMDSPVLIVGANEPTEETMLRMPHALRVFGGPTLSQFVFGEGHSSELNEYFEMNFGLGGGLMMEFQRWSQSFSIGVSWNEFVQHLDYIEQTENAIVMQGIQTIQINEITGDTMAFVLGDIQGVEYRQRYVSNYNTYRAFAIPLEFQRKKYVGRWELGLGVGALVQFRTHAKGRTLTPEGLVADYSDLHQSRLSWMSTMRLYAGLFIVPEWRVDISLSAGLQRFNNAVDGDQVVTEIPTWQGRLRNGQIQFGLTRYFEPQ